LDIDLSMKLSNLVYGVGNKQSEDCQSRK
jgi:hypothetical protein